MTKTIGSMHSDAITSIAERGTFDQALGKFISIWADTEAELYRVLVHYAEVKPSVARAIFSGTRAKTMIDFVRAIAENTKLQAIRADDLEFVFAQMQAINTIRDRIVHFLSDIRPYQDNPKEVWISNWERSSRPGKRFQVNVGASAIDAMSDDLTNIQYHLHQHRTLVDGDFFPWQRTPGLPTAWRYKPQQPNPPSARNASSPLKPPRPQQSSRAKRLEK